MPNLPYKVLDIADATWLPLELVKSYLRVSEDNDDALIKTMISAAIQAAEAYSRISILKRTIRIKSKQVGHIEVPVLPMLDVIAIKDDDGATLASEDYNIVEASGLLSFLQRTNKQLTIEYRAGYADEHLPAAIKSGILMHVAEMYDRRGQISPTPKEVLMLYSPYRRLMI